MFFRDQATPIQKDKTLFLVHSFNILAIVMLLGFCSSLVHADSATSSVTVNSSVKPSFKYQEIKSIVKKLANRHKPEELEGLVEKSTDFIQTFPEYKRVDEVYYRLGNALFRLERVEESVKVFEKLLKEHPEKRWIAPSLLELGLAYDKLSKHDKADAAYKKLIDHPKYGKRSYAQYAKKILEQDKTSRKGELPKPSGASSVPASKLVGKPAPDFQVKDLKGEELSLKKFRGQVVLLDFWATWCGPCIAEMPHVKQTYEKYKDQKFQIIGISLDNSKIALEAFIEKEELAWTHHWDQSQKVMTQYGVTGIPSTFLIDGEGVIRNTNLIGPKLETAVAALVKENLTKPVGTSPQSIPATKLIKPSPASQKAESLEDLKAKMNEWVGKPAPDFQVTDLEGKEISLKDYRGQIVLLDFWATSCGPCIAEMPKVKKTYEKYKDQKFQIIGISSDKSKQPLEAYIEKEGLGWIHTWDENGDLRNLYEIIGIPTAFLIDGEGVIRKASLGGFDVETAVAELVKENLAKPADSPLIETPADSPKTGQDVDPKAKEIIDAAVAAHGGLEKLAAVKNIVIKYRSFEHFPDGDVQDEGTAKFYIFPEKFRGEWNDDYEIFTKIINGNSVFEIEDGQISQLPPEEAESVVKDYKDTDFRELIWPLTDLLKKDVTVQYEGTEKVKDVPASVLLVTQPSGKKIKVFISEKTHYVVQFSYSRKIGKDEKNVEKVVKYLDDYRDVNGIKISHHRTTMNGEYRQILITDIKLNAEIDEALFRPDRF